MPSDRSPHSGPVAARCIAASDGLRYGAMQSDAKRSGGKHWLALQCARMRVLALARRRAFQVLSPPQARVAAFATQCLNLLAVVALGGTGAETLLLTKRS